MPCCDECADKLLSIHVGFDPRAAVDRLEMDAIRINANGVTRVGADPNWQGAADAASQTKEGKSILGKVANVGADAAAGSALGGAIGSIVPGVGTVIGGAVGSVVGGVYGAIDQFGGDVVDLFNPPAFGEDDYTRIKRKCVESGGEVVGGIAPDQYGACRYPDGSLSGGDWPFPGTWNLHQSDERIVDRAAYEAHLPPMCAGPLGVPMPIPPGWTCQPGIGPVPPPPPVPPALLPNPKLGAVTTDPRYNIAIQKKADALRAGKPVPPDVLAAIEQYKPKPPIASLTAAVLPVAKAPAPATIPLPRSASTLANALLAAKSGDTAAQAGIAKVVDKAEHAPASFAAQIAYGLEDAQKRAVRADFVHFWLFGSGAARLRANGLIHDA